LNKKIVIIDGNSLINRTFYALPIHMANKEGLHTNAIYGFVNILNKIYKDYNPDYITVAFDMKKPTFRHNEFKEYKAGRKKMPEELAEQMPVLKEVLDAFNIHRVELEGFEADDLIGTLAKFCENKDVSPIIITGDKDALQLASDKTKVLITKKGISTLEEYGYDEVLDKYGVTPTEFIDVKGLMGDKSDNIPGVPGIGEKTAIKLIKEHKSIENLLGNLEGLTKKMKEKLTENAEQAILSKRLATIIVDVPVEVSLDELKREEPNRERVIELFNKLEFKKLLKDFHIKKEKKEHVESDKEVNIIDSIEKAKSLNEKIIENKEFVLKIFSDHNNIRDEKIIGTFILVQNEIYFIKDDNLLEELKKVLEDNHIKKIGYEIKQDMISLKEYDIKLDGILMDVKLGAYLIDPSKKDYHISNIYDEFLDEYIENEEELLGKGKGKLNYSQLEEEKLMSYGGNLVTAVSKLGGPIEERMKEDDLYELYMDVELPLIKVLGSMEYIGFKVDREKLKEIGKELDEKIISLTAQIYAYADEEFNINSTKQLGVILFDKLDLPPVKKTKTGYSTNAEVLEKLYDKHDIIPRIIEYRQLVKLKSTYVDGLESVISEKTGKIHSSFNQMVTATGRISSTEPNLQNIPIKLEMGRNIRKVFVPTSDEYTLLDADYSQIELRVLAHICDDENLIEAFRKGQDIHKTTASKVFDVPMDSVTSIQRSKAKAVNFGIVYGISDYGLSENLHITKKEAKKYIDEYLNKYHGVKEYMENIVKEGKEHGYVTTLLNRRRYIPELKAKNFNLRSFGERTAMNTPIQGTAADIIKIAMVKVYERLKENNLKSRLILQVHDELIIEVHKDEMDMVKNILKEEMENAVSLQVPLDIDMNEGVSWYETK
jgi:DNA polymerase-1